MSKIFIAIPHDSVDSPFSKDFKIPKKIEGHEIIIRIMDTKDLIPPPNIDKICHARELLVQEFMKTDCDKLLFLDSDIIATEEDLKMLADSLKDIVMGQCVYRAWWNNNDVLRRKYPPPHNKKTTRGYPGITMIKRFVFEKIQPPYFRLGNRRVFWNEGSWLFKNCLKNGIEAYVYSNVQVGHQCRKTGKIYRFTNYNKEVIGE